MLTLPEEMWLHPLLNLHPAEPGGPAGTWQEGIWQLIEQKASRAGGVMHPVTRSPAGGPPVPFADGKVRIEEGRVVGADGRPMAAYDLTAEIDRLVEVRS